MKSSTISPQPVERSRRGVLERFFTLAFRGLVYPQIWEDPGGRSGGACELSAELA